MTYLDAAYTILQEDGQPLHYAEITQRALDQGLIEPSGLTPGATMGSRLYTDTKQEGSLFVRTAQRALFGLAEWQSQGINAQVKAINQQTREALRAQLLGMAADRFEVLVGNLLLEMGFDENSVEVTRRSHDGGIDVVGAYRAAGLAQVNAAVQVKRWKRNVGAPTVTQLRGSLQVHQQGIIITTSGFSKAAREEATAPNKSRIGLIDGEELLDLLIKHRVGVAEESLKVLSLDQEWWGALLGAADANTDSKPSLAEKGTASLLAVVDEEMPQIQGGAGVGDTSETGQKKPWAARRLSARPTAVILFGERRAISDWWQIPVVTCEELAIRHGEAFGPAAMSVSGRTRRYLDTTGAGMTRPKPVGETGFVVEVNLSARDCVRVARRFLAALGHGEDALSVTV